MTKYPPLPDRVESGAVKVAIVLSVLQQLMSSAEKH